MIAPTEDIDRLMALMELGFDPVYGEAWNRQQVTDALLTGNCHYFLMAQSGRQAAEGDLAIGFYLSRTILQDVELLLIAVNPKYRHRGYGRKLLIELMNDIKIQGARRVFLEMRRGNPAEKLYRDFGFIPVGERPNYYRLTDGQRVDAITFALDLNPRD